MYLIVAFMCSVGIRSESRFARVCYLSTVYFYRLLSQATTQPLPFPPAAALPPLPPPPLAPGLAALSLAPKRGNIGASAAAAALHAACCFAGSCGT